MNKHYDYGKSKLVDNFYNQVISETIKEIRISKGLSYADLSDKIGNFVARQTIHHYEQKDTKIRIDTFNKIAKALDMTPRELFDKINFNYFNKINEFRENFE